MPSEPILLARDGAVATVTLNRPQRRNALDRAAWCRLKAVFDELDDDDSVRCVVLRGAGGRAFGAGADIAAFANERNDAAQAAEYGRDVAAAMNGVAAGRHPAIALIEGICVGGGLELACACDLRLCGASSRFGIPVNRLGLTMAYDELRILLSVVAEPVAKEILLSAELFDARRALQMGLVNRVVDDDKLEATVYELAASVAAGAPRVNRWHRRFIARLARPEPLTEAELAEGYAAFDTEDFQRGVGAFLDKRDPEFEGD